jgi:hypothetical protein
MLDDSSLGVEAEDEPFRINSHEPALPTNPVDEVKVREVLGGARLAKEGNDFSMRPAAKLLGSPEIGNDAAANLLTPVHRGAVRPASGREPPLRAAGAIVSIRAARPKHEKRQREISAVFHAMC